MDLKQLKSIMSIFEHSDADKLEVSESDGVNTFSVKVEKSGANVVAVPAGSPAVTVKAIEPAAPAEPDGKDVAAKSDEGVLDYNLVGEVKSPMVGKGDKVKKGDTLCLIEAMKLMNEVVAERDGEVVEVCVENGSLVEFGQVLLRIF